MASLRTMLRVPSTLAIRCLSTSVPSSAKEVPKGRIAAKVPARLELKGGKRYLWCACGYSKNQPWCDGTHLFKRWKLKIKQQPVFFKAPESKKYSMCTCKQTDKAPYCDGAHKRKEVKEAVIEDY